MAPPLLRQVASIRLLVVRVLLLYFDFTSSDIHRFLKASHPESRIWRSARFAYFMIYVRQSLDNSEGGCSPGHRLRPSDFVSALMDIRRKRAAAGTLV